MKKQALSLIAALFALVGLLTAFAYAADAAESSAADAYAILYEDGELVFQTDDAPETGRAVVKTYEVDFSADYAGTVQPDTPWYKEREAVLVANFADKVSPVSTAYWFIGCCNLERVENVKNLDAAKVTTMYGMFEGCYKLKSLDLSAFDTANVTDMGYMFFSCYSLQSLDLSAFKTAKVQNMRQMFYGCNGLQSLDVSSFNTTNVTDMYKMFGGCKGLKSLDLSSFDTVNVADMQLMFFYCNSLKTIYASDRFASASATSLNMFYSCTSLVGGNGTKYDSSRIDAAYARIDNPPSAPGYFSDKSAPVAYGITDAVTENGKFSVTLTNPGAATLAVSYFDASGRFGAAELREIEADAGTVTLTLWAEAKTARVMLWDSGRRPLCAAYAADVGGAQEPQDPEEAEEAQEAQDPADVGGGA